MGRGSNGGGRGNGRIAAHNAVKKRTTGSHGLLGVGRGWPARLGSHGAVLHGVGAVGSASWCVGSWRVGCVEVGWPGAVGSGAHGTVVDGASGWGSVAAAGQRAARRGGTSGGCLASARVQGRGRGRLPGSWRLAASRERREEEKRAAAAAWE
jgi:hypothetical protein